MPKAEADRQLAQHIANRRLLFPVAITLMQGLAAIFFVLDAIEEQYAQPGGVVTLDTAMECFIGLSLISGILVSARHVRRLTRQLYWQEQSLTRARGALADHIAVRFQQWGLTPGEADVALFALKGCDVAEIARLRGAASGTVRSQLSQIYAKAGVRSQAAFTSLFIEDLLEPPQPGVSGKARANED
ncbi:MAG: helix-turn-helix transcriptional regulator [Novosphingobium sp.]